MLADVTPPAANLPEWLALVSGDGIAVGGDKLRHWGISETWRIRWTDGSTTIVKRGAGEEGNAVDVYEQLLIPFGISAPRLLAAHRGDGFAVLMFADLGRHSLEERPAAEGWHAAARLLARMRHQAQGRVSAAGRFRFATAEITDSWVRATAALATVRPDLPAAAYADEWAALGARGGHSRHTGGDHVDRRTDRTGRNGDAGSRRILLSICRSGRSPIV